MRDDQELELVSCRAVTRKVTVNIVDPSVHLLLFSRRPASLPARVRDVQARRYCGITRQPQVLLKWRGLASRMIRTYEVLYAPTRQGRYRRVNRPDIICTAFLQVADEVRGWYKVRAVDYWGRAGQASAPIRVS